MKPKDLKGTSFLPSVGPVLEALKAGHRQIRLIGLLGSARAWAMAGIFRESGRPLLVVLPTLPQAEAFYQDLACWFQWLGMDSKDLVYFPEAETLPYERAASYPDIIRQRLQALYQMAQEKPAVLVTPVTALIQRVPAKEALLRCSIRLSKALALDREALLGRCVEMGYRRVELVEHAGEFGVRGGLVDLFSPAQNEPVRVEWSGDTIETIRFFDPETQLSKGETHETVILPISENSNLPLVPLTDYLTAEGLVAWDDPDACDKQAQTLTSEKILDLGKMHPSLLLQTLDLQGRPVHRFSIRSPESLGLGLPGTPLTTALEILEELRHQSRVMVVAKSLGQQERLLDLFHEHDLPAVRGDRDLSETQDRRHLTEGALPFVIAVGALSNGFYDPESRLAVFTDEDLFGKAVRHRPLSKPKTARFLTSLEDLKVKDFIVHLQHGIGQYQGLRRLTIGGYESDFLVIRYLRGDTLYVPLDRLNLVQKYMGGEGHTPALDRLGGLTWARTTKRVKKAVETIAKELLELYAAREVGEGHAFSSDDHLSREFEAAFEFEETPDQLQAISDVKRDMEKPRPMDRLVCGDVGYGKTEVAMRAAFKAVMDNQQAAVLVPTTLLAQQHYQTFSQRFSPFPVRVEMLSRFRTSREQKAILTDLSHGIVDILIGTHRLLQKDVEFHRLGLLIVDEEQRFGVTHKERLKQLRKTVDVLTLTATPIPRTLQMSLVGIRDLSVIESPPPDRLAIRTVLTRLDPPVIRTAILRELARSGQVFFVHNRIEDIERIGRYLSDLVPEARIAIAHGRMRERALESVMLKFVRQEYNLLLSTSIIESGLDIPTANTILINNAHQFGVADLYQLRGRVGRSGHQAYAYFLVPSEEGLTGEAKKRLSALQEFCELGAGFRIAARDLEIRGAGDLLGRQQSGHVAAVGLEYYLQLIEKAVQELRGKPSEEAIEPTLNLRVSAFLPEDYIPDVYQRLGIYKRLSELRKEEDLSSLWIELVDRYGAPPEPVERLWEVVRLKLLARSLSVVRLSSTSDGVAIAFDPKRGLSDHQIKQLLALDAGDLPTADPAKGRCMSKTCLQCQGLVARDGIRFLSEFSLELLLSDASWPATFSTLKNCLQRLEQYGRSRPDED